MNIMHLKTKLIKKFKEAEPNPLRLTIKLFCLVWGFLLLYVFLKLSFNYWQPYVIPTEQLEKVSNFIDGNNFIKITLNLILYVINVVIMVLCGLRQWKFKSNRQMLIVVVLSILSFTYGNVFNETTFNTLFITIVLPIILNKKSWLWVILNFIISNLFMLLSLFLEGISNTDNLCYIAKLFMQFDYYIMLIMNYILFNFIRIKKEMK